MKYLYITLLVLLIGCANNTIERPIAKVKIIDLVEPYELNTYQCEVIESEDISKDLIKISWLNYQQKTDNFFPPREEQIYTVELKLRKNYYELIDIL